MYIGILDKLQKIQIAFVRYQFGAYRFLQNNIINLNNNAENVKQ